MELGTVCLCTQEWVIMALFNKVNGLCQGKQKKKIKKERLENPF